MLARNWLTAKQLGITEAERSALVEVMDRLRDGRIPAEMFNMGVWSLAKEAEILPCCIAGHAARIDRNAFMAENNGNTGAMRVRLHNLFFTDRPMDRTPEEGAFAIESFLRTGKASWPVLS